MSSVWEMADSTGGGVSVESAQEGVTDESTQLLLRSSPFGGFQAWSNSGEGALFPSFSFRLQDSSAGWLGSPQARHLNDHTTLPHEPSEPRRIGAAGHLGEGGGGHRGAEMHGIARMT